MNLFKRPYEQLAKEAIFIFREIKKKVGDDSDCDWTYYKTPEAMRLEIDIYIAALEKADFRLLDEMYMHFLPTAAYQEHSLQNDWTVEYHILANKFDNLYERLKKYR